MNKNLLKKRLVIYLILSFGFVWIPTIVFAVCGGTYEDPAMQLLLSYSMLCPAIAVLITRKVTGEGSLV